MKHLGLGLVLAGEGDAKDSRGDAMKLLQNIWKRVEGQTVGEVPRDIALCEFDCRKPQCREGEWENCIRRLRHATGELAPADKPTSETAGVVDAARKNDAAYQTSI